MFIYFILEKVKEYSTPHSLILNFDQTTSSFIPASSKTLAKKQ